MKYFLSLLLLLFFNAHCFSQVWTNNGAAVNIVSGTVVNGGSLENSSGTITNTGTITLTADFINLVTVNGSGNYNIGGNWTNSGTFTPGTGTATFNGAGAQSITSTTFNNLIINKASGTVSLTGDAFINGDLGINSGTLDISTYSSNRTSAGGSLTIGNGAVLFVSGINNFPSDFSNVALNNNSTVEYNGIVAQSVAGIIYGNLIFSNGGITAKTLGTPATISGNIVVNSGATFIDTSTLKIAGSITNSGTFTASNGTIEMNGSSAQAIPAATFSGNAVKNLTINNNAGVTLGGALSVTDVLTLSNGSLASDGYLTLKSTASGTASVAPIPVNAFGVPLNFIAGNVIVERYIPGHRAWRLLTIPVITAQTINEAWQEGAVNTTLTYPGGNNDPNPGYGTHITGIAGGTAIGYDLGTQNNFSLKIYDHVNTTTVTAGYKGIQQLDLGKGTNNTPLNLFQGYMLFVRGNRGTNLNLGAGAPLSNTTLRAQGILKTGTQPAVLTLDGFNVIGNPFAATIDMRRIEKAGGVSEFFYLYDARLGTLGDFQTFLWDGIDYLPLPGGGSYAAPYATAGSANFIQSGQAFFVESIGAGSVVIKEVAKELTTNSMIFEPIRPWQQLKTNLYVLNTATNLLDATLTQFSFDGNNAVDGKDAMKIQSISGGTYLGMLRDSQNLIIERRQSITVNDSIFYNLMTASKRNYRFEFIADKLDVDAVSGFLEDAYLKTSIPINLNDTTNVDFTVNADAASSAADRFRIVFEAKFIVLPLPFTFKNAKANQQNNDIAVEWTTENEANIKSYDVETSANGLQFEKAATVIAKGSNSIETYQWLDEHAEPGVYYYRIRSINEKGEVLYSDIVKVLLNTRKSEIVVYPNPVVNGRINVKFTNQAKGNYVVKLIDNLGRVLITKEIYLSESTVLEIIKANKNMTNGTYRLKVVYPDNNVTSVKVILR